MAQLCHEPVPVNASPTPNLEVIQAKFFLGRPEAGFNRPAAKGNSQQPPKRCAVTTNNTVAEKVFDFAGADITTDDQGVLFGGKFVSGLPPEASPFDFPDFRTAVGVFDAVTLPFLCGEDGRVSRQIINSETGFGFGNARNFELVPFSFCFVKEPCESHSVDAANRGNYRVFRTQTLRRVRPGHQETSCRDRKVRRRSRR